MALESPVRHPCGSGGLYSFQQAARCQMGVAGAQLSKVVFWA
jgi:hypothetical protein